MNWGNQENQTKGSNRTGRIRLTRITKGTGENDRVNWKNRGTKRSLGTGRIGRTRRSMASCMHGEPEETCMGTRGTRGDQRNQGNQSNQGNQRNHRGVARIYRKGRLSI